MTELKTRNDYENMTVSELHDTLNQREEDRDNTISKRNSKTRKAELIEMLMSDDLLTHSDTDEAYVNGSQDLVEIPLSKIEICPLNPRPALDYQDFKHQDNLRAANGVIGAVTVTAAKNIDSDAPDDLYYAIAGNRTIFNLKIVVEADGWADSLDDYMVGCQVREYDGSPRDVKAQILRELALDHSSSRDFTVVDNYRLIKAKSDLGLSTKQIAKEMDLAPTQVSKIKRIGLLSERLQTLVQAHYRGDLYAQRSAKVLNEHGILFALGNDDVQILGINQSNAFVMCEVFPRKPTRSGFFSKQDYDNALYDWIATRDNLNKLFESDDVIQHAVTDNSSTFETWLHIRVSEAGILTDEQLGRLSTFKNLSKPTASVSVDTLGTLEPDSVEIVSANDSVEDDAVEEVMLDDGPDDAGLLESSLTPKVTILDLWENRKADFDRLCRSGELDMKDNWYEDVSHMGNEGRQLLTRLVEMGLLDFNVADPSL